MVVQRLARVLIAVLLVVAAASVGLAQRWSRLREGPSVPPRFPEASFEDGAFTHCKIMYRSVVREANGMGWSTDYPYAGINLMTRLSELTKTPISIDSDGNPNYWVVRLTDDALFRCPFTMATDVGTLEFSEEEVSRLREYLLKGGFLWVDDFWGSAAWAQWSAQIRRVLPEFPIEDVPPDHPLMHALYPITRRRRSRASTSGGTAAV